MSSDDLRTTLRGLRKQQHDLLREYTEVKTRVGEYAHRRYMTGGEEMERKALQRVKLSKKDALVVVKQRIDELEAALAPSN